MWELAAAVFFIVCFAVTAAVVEMLWDLVGSLRGEDYD